MKIKHRKLDENWSVFDRVETQAVVPPTYQMAIEDHKKKLESIEEERKAILKEVGITEEEFKNGFAGAGPNNEKVKSRPETKKMHLSESLFDDNRFEEVENLVDALYVNRLYNGAAHRGADIPAPKIGYINQANIPDNMRLKYFDVNILNDESILISYTTQEGFNDADFDEFVEEVKDAVFYRADNTKPIYVVVEVTCRDGKEYGFGHTTFILEGENPSGCLEKDESLNEELIPWSDGWDDDTLYEIKEVL